MKERRLADPVECLNKSGSSIILGALPCEDWQPVATMLRERRKQGNCEAESIDALHRDGQVRSSVEAAVMAVERRDLVIQLPTIDQLFNRRSH